MIYFTIFGNENRIVFYFSRGRGGLIIRSAVFLFAEVNDQIDNSDGIKNNQENDLPRFELLHFGILLKDR